MNIVKHIPNTITSMNLLSGVLGVIAAFNGRLDISFYLMIAAAVFDFLDGFSARLLKAYSPMGKELDSLADLVSFGLLPSIMLNRTMIAVTGHAGFLSYVPLIIVVFSALRLAKFNIDEAQTENFLGLPTPACAMIAGSFAYYICQVPDTVMISWLQGDILIPAASVLLAILLVCRIPMFSLKFKKGGKKGPIHSMRIAIIAVFLACILLIALLGMNWSMVVLLTFLIYLIMNLVNAMITK